MEDLLKQITDLLSAKAERLRNAARDTDIFDSSVLGYGVAAREIERLFKEANEIIDLWREEERKRCLEAAEKAKGSLALQAMRGGASSGFVYPPQTTIPNPFNPLANHGKPFDLPPLQSHTCGKSFFATTPGKNLTSGTY